MPKSTVVGPKRSVVLLATRTESMLRCWSCRTNSGSALRGVVQRRGLGQFAGQALAPRVRVHVEARLGIRRELIAEVRVAAFDMTVAVIAISVLALRRAGDEPVDGPACAAGAGLAAHIAEAAGIEPRFERRGIAAGRRDKIDRAAQRVGAVAQRVGALVHFDIAVGGRIDLEEIEQAVGCVDRDAVHVHVDAAVAVVARQTGAADRHPVVDIRFGLCDDARHPAEHVLDRIRGPILELGVGHERDATRDAVDDGPRLRDTRDGQTAARRCLQAGSRWRARIHLRRWRLCGAPYS